MIECDRLRGADASERSVGRMVYVERTGSNIGGKGLVGVPGLRRPLRELEGEVGDDEGERLRKSPEIGADAVKSALSDIVTVR